eukprot:SAG31_NODE_335_length_17509_cov_7.127972_16_plen_113_part_00
MLNLFPQLMGEAGGFFGTSLPHKKSYHFPPRYGYVDGKDRESFRLLTGELPARAFMPPELASASRVSQMLDLLAAQVCAKIWTSLRSSAPYYQSICLLIIMVLSLDSLVCVL